MSFEVLSSEQWLLAQVRWYKLSFWDFLSFPARMRWAFLQIWGQMRFINHSFRIQRCEKNGWHRLFIFSVFSVSILCLLLWGLSTTTSKWLRLILPFWEGMCWQWDSVQNTFLSGWSLWCLPVFVFALLLCSSSEILEGLYLGSWDLLFQLYLEFSS